MAEKEQDTLAGVSKELVCVEQKGSGEMTSFNNCYHTIPAGVELSDLTSFKNCQTHIEEKENNNKDKKDTRIAVDGNGKRKLKAELHFLGRFLSRLSSIDYQKEDCIQIGRDEMKGWYSLYQPLIERLLDAGIIIRDDSYVSEAIATDSTPVKTKSYGLTKNYQDAYKQVPADVDMFLASLKKIEATDYKPDHSHTEVQVIGYQYDIILKHCTVEEPKWLELDADVDTKELIKVALTKLKQGVLNMTSSKKVERFHNVLIQMPKIGRQFIKYKGTTPFLSCDISASHFTLLAGITNCDVANLQKYVQDDFYQSISGGMYDRETIKAQSFSYLYGSNYRSKKIQVKDGETFKTVLHEREIDCCMKEKLPEIHKMVYGKTKKEKKQLCYDLMKLEADIVVRQVGGILMDSEVPFYTIHDCVMTTPENTIFVKKVMEEVIKLNVGINPRIKVESL